MHSKNTKDIDYITQSFHYISLYHSDSAYPEDYGYWGMTTLPAYQRVN